MTRRFGILALAAFNAALLLVAPLADPPPAPAGHAHHLADDSAPGCQPLHDEHCAICRVLSTEPVGAEPLARLAHAAHASTDSGPAPVRVLRAAAPLSDIQARAPPLG